MHSLIPSSELTWGFSPEARRGSQGASRAAPGKSGLRARGEGERVMALESREGLSRLSETKRVAPEILG